MNEYNQTKELTPFIQENVRKRLKLTKSQLSNQKIKKEFIRNI